MTRKPSRTRRGKEIRRVAINTGGGDAPGLNAVIRAVVLAAHRHGWEVVGIRDGYNGLFLPDQYPDGGLIRLTPERVQGITHLGGTIIGTTNTGNPLRYPTPPSRRDDGRGGPHRRPRRGPRGQPHRRGGSDRGRRLADHRERPGPEGRAHRGRAQDDRQRPEQDGDHLRLRLRGLLRHRMPGPAALHGRGPPPGDGGRGDGPVRRLDRAQHRGFRHRRRHPDPGDPLRRREGRGQDQGARRPRARTSRSWSWPKGPSPGAECIR